MSAPPLGPWSAPTKIPFPLFRAFVRVASLKVLNESKYQTSREEGRGEAQRRAVQREKGMIKYVRMDALDGWLRFHPALHARCES